MMPGPARIGQASLVVTTADTLAALQREGGNCSAADPYGAIIFILALAIRFRWTVYLRSYFFQTASKPTAGYPHIFIQGRTFIPSEENI
jgi:hypothetical protein